MGGRLGARLTAPPAWVMAVGVSMALSACAPAEAPGPDADEILWDTWGVPHIYGTDEGAVLRGFGRAQARAHGDLILRLYGQARGRAAEYWGEDWLDSDRWVRTVDVPGTAEGWLAAQSPDALGRLEAFAGGFNAYALENPDAFAEDVRQVLPVEPVDILAHGIRALHYTFIVNAGVAREAQGALRSSDEAPPPDGEAVALRERALGSNAWAIAPSRSASGNALLLANPHLPWGDLFTWFEAQLVAPGMDITGATLVGLPAIAIGFNDRLGWTHTVNTYDGADVYRVRREGDQYRFDGELRDFDVRTETIRVRREDGTLGSEELTVRSTVHGPVLAMDGDEALALRVAGLDVSGVVEQWRDMGRARSLEEFEGAVSRLQIPMFNVIYADGDGHILYLFNGRVPERNVGDVGYWAGVVPGDSSRTLWTATLPYGDLPRTLDPPSGWVQNANDPPWTSTVPRVLRPGDYPGSLAPDYMHFRAQRSAAMLLADESITFDELLTYKLSTRMGLADRVLDDLVALAEGSGDADVRQAAEVLAAWDRTADADSRGGVLFLEWAQRWLRSAGFTAGVTPQPAASLAFAEPWDPERPTSTPAGIADGEGALEILAEAAAAVEERHGAADVAWGDVHRLRVGSVDLPANGASGDPGGVFRVVGYSEAGDGNLVASSGDSYVVAVEFGEPIRARTLLSYGNWSQPGSAHLGDQTELFAAKELRPVWRTRSEVEANLESREAVPGPGGQ